MYGKILHGASFGGLINYINDPRKNAILVASSDGINLTNNQTITDSFVMQAGLSARTKKPVGHFILSFSPHDTLHINDNLLGQIVNDYLKRMDMTTINLLHSVISTKNTHMFISW